MIIQSKFATKEEIFTEEFKSINQTLNEINARHQLYDHTEINNSRFPWSNGMFKYPSIYVSRMWEYPFAILSAELKSGMSCADIGCGSSPFTICLREIVGKNLVTGFDPDEIQGNSVHSTFGANRTLLNSLDIHYKRNNMSQLDAADESFDVVFCISVIEHIEEPIVWQQGVAEMVRILKPGGRLVITMDIGLNHSLSNPLDIIKYAGLPMAGNFNLHWPEERFLQLGSATMDVFGLVLEKTSKPIFRNYEKTERIPHYIAFKKFIPEFIDSKQIQIGRDLRSKNGFLKTLTKLVMGKYNK